MSEAIGHLADGTPLYAPVGELLADGDQVCCHLCGRWFLSVASHLRHHGWSKDAYVEAFGLERSNPLSGPATRKRRAAALAARHTEPALLAARTAARERSGSGALTAAAARAALGRPHPAERRSKTLAALGRVDPAARAAGNRRRGEQHRQRVAAGVAERFGYTSFADYLAARTRSGLSMAAISREAGLHKDWVGRHATLPASAPATTADRRDARLAEAARAHGFGADAARMHGFDADVAAYLRDAHHGRHRTVAAIALEAGVSRWSVLAALQRHGITAVAHTEKRHRAEARQHATARELGFATMTAYVTARRAGGRSWRAISAECGMAETTLRRFQNRREMRTETDRISS